MTTIKSKSNKPYRATSGAAGYGLVNYTKIKKDEHNLEKTLGYVENISFNEEIINRIQGKDINHIILAFEDQQSEEIFTEKSEEVIKFFVDLLTAHNTKLLNEVKKLGYLKQT